MESSMMKLIIISMSCIALLSGCATNHFNDPQNPSTTQVSSGHTQDQQTLHFVGPYDLSLTLTTSDNFETAILTDNSDTQHQLKRTISANGIRLESNSGVVIHFKNTPNGNQGYVMLVKDKPIEISEFKQ